MNANPQLVNSSPEPGQLLVSTRFQESYDLIRPVSGGKDITPFANSSGDLDVYTVGTNNRVFRFRPQVGGDAGYSEDDLGIEAFQLAIYPAAQTDRDSPDILGLDATGQLTLSQADAAGRYTQRVFQPPSATKKIKQMRATPNLGNVYVNVILEDDTVGTNFIKSDGTWAATDWVPIKESAGSSENGKAARIAMCENNPVQTALYGIGLDQRVLFADNRFRFSAWRRLGTLEAVAITVVEDEDDRLNIFAVDTDGHLWQKREKQYYTGIEIQWDDWVQLDTKAELSGIRAVVAADGLLEVFGIGRDGILWHAAQMEGGTNQVWGTLFPLGNPVPASIFAVGRNESGYSETYSVTRDDQLYRFWQDPNTTQWTSQRIPIPQPTEMATVSVHSVAVQVVDEENNPQSGARVFLKTSNLVSLRINGLAYVVSEFVGREIVADATGMIKIEYVTNTLTAPTLFFTAEFMGDGEGVTVEPNAHLQDRLYETTADDVWNAKGAGGEYLLQGADRTPENADAIAQAMRQSMSLGKAAPDAQRSLRYLEKNTRTTGLRHHGRGTAGSPFRLVPEEVEEQHWRLEFHEGGVRFHRFDRAGAEAFLESQREELMTAAEAGFLGVDWGDVWNSVKEGIADIGDFVVTTIVDGVTGLVKEIKTAITLLVDGVKFLWEATIEFFQQAFDIVQGLWEKFKVFFEDLFAWLAFLFDWPDIQRTARAMRHSINTGLEFGAVAIRSLKEPIMQGFDGIEELIKTTTDEFLRAIDPEETNGEYGSENGEPDPELVAANGHEPLLNGFLDNASDTTVTASRARAAGAADTSALDALFDELVKLSENFQFGEGKAAWDEALAYFEEIGDNPSQILELALSGTVKMVEAVALFAVEAAEGVVLSIIDLVADLLLVVRDLLNEEWEIPFVSQLWKLITGDTLSFKPIDLLTTIVAVPTTVTYKAVEGEAPFPDDASVKAFENAYTVQWLCQQSGIQGPQGIARLAAEDLSAMTATVSTTKKVFVYAGAATWYIRVYIEMPQTLAAAGEASPKALNVASVIGRFASVLFSCPWLLDPKAGGLSCKGTTEFNNLIWVLQVVFGPTRGAFIIVFSEKIKAKKLGWIGDATLTLWGVARCGMYIALAVREGSEKAAQSTANIISTLGAQAFRFAAIPQVAKPLKFIPPVALALYIDIAYTITAFLLVSTVQGQELAESRRLARLRFATLPV